MNQSTHHIAGQRYLRAKLKTSKGSFNSAPGAAQYLKKNGYEGTLSLNPGHFGESVRTRIALAKTMRDEFLAGVEFAWDAHYKEKHPDSE